MSYVLLVVLLWALYCGLSVACHHIGQGMLEVEDRDRERDRLGPRPRYPTASLSAWVRNGLALIRSSNARDITNDIISVQPMTKPVGKLSVEIRQCRVPVARQE